MSEPIKKTYTLKLPDGGSLECSVEYLKELQKWLNEEFGQQNNKLSIEDTLRKFKEDAEKERMKPRTGGVKEWPHPSDSSWPNYWMMNQVVSTTEDNLTHKNPVFGDDK